MLLALNNWALGLKILRSLDLQSDTLPTELWSQVTNHITQHLHSGSSLFCRSSSSFKIQQQEVYGKCPKILDILFHTILA